VKLPRLQILTASVFKADQDKLKDFLANHEHLEEVDVAVKREFGKNLFNVIRQLCHNLKKLHLKAKKFVDSASTAGGRQKNVDWTFLGALTRLRDFQLSRPHCKNPNWKHMETERVSWNRSHGINWNDWASEESDSDGETLDSGQDTSLMVSQSCQPSWNSSKALGI